MKQDRAAYEREDSGQAAHDHCEDLFGAVTDSDRVENLDGREKSNQVAEEDDDDANVEQDRAKHELAPPEELTGKRLPRERVPLIADDTADQGERTGRYKDKSRIRTHALSQILRVRDQTHGRPEFAGGSIRESMLRTSGQPALGSGPNVTSLSSQARSRASRSFPSGSGAAIRSAIIFLLTDCPDNLTRAENTDA